MTTVQQIMAEMGVDDTAQVLTPEWAMDLFERGALIVVEVHIGRRGQRTKLTPADLGITLPSDPDRRRAITELLNLGDKHLIPLKLTRKLNSLAELGRQALVNHSVPSPFGRVLNAQGFEKFKETFGNYRTQYFSIRDEILTNYETIRAEMAAKYEKAAYETWLRVSRATVRLSPDQLAQIEVFTDRVVTEQVEARTRAGDPPSPVVVERWRARAALVWWQTRKPEDLTPDQRVEAEEYIAEYVGRVMQDFPTRPTIETGFVYEYVPTFVPLPSLVAQDKVAADQTYDDAARERVLRDEVSRYWLARKQALIDQFLQEMVRDIRGRVYETVKAAAAAIRKNQAVPGKTVEALAGVLDMLRTISPYQDQELERAFEVLKSQLDRPSKDRDKDQILAQVEAIQVLTRASLVQLGAGRTGRERDPELLSPPLVAEVRAARTQLGLTEDVAPPPVIETSQGWRSAKTL